MSTVAITIACRDAIHSANLARFVINETIKLSYSNYTIAVNSHPCIVNNIINNDCHDINNIDFNLLYVCDLLLFIVKL